MVHRSKRTASSMPAPIGKPRRQVAKLGSSAAMIDFISSKWEMNCSRSLSHSWAVFSATAGVITWSFCPVW